jgi:uncharacterized protein (UPF0264 family)
VKQQRLLVSIRGKNEASEAVKGGAHILDVEYPKSALGTPYPINIHTVRAHTPANRLVSTNIGEMQYRWATASQAAVGVAQAGADIIKIGLAELKADDAREVMQRAIRNVRWWFRDKTLIATFFADDRKGYVDPIVEAATIADGSGADGVLIDTFDKAKGKGLLDFYGTKDIAKFVKACRKHKVEAWIAGSITKEQLPRLWRTGVDVICVRGAACEKGTEGERMGKVKAEIVRRLVETIP